MHLLTQASRVFAVRCVQGIRAHRARCQALAHRSLALITALAPQIGYLHAARLAKESRSSGKSILELVVGRRLLDARSAKRWLDPIRLSR